MGELVADSRCPTCQAVTAASTTSTVTGTRVQSKHRGANWEMDCTELKPGKYSYKYPLVFIDTFSGRVEAYPTKKDRYGGQEGAGRNPQVWISLTAKVQQRACLHLSGNPGIS